MKAPNFKFVGGLGVNVAIGDPPRYNADDFENLAKTILKSLTSGIPRGSLSGARAKPGRNRHALEEIGQRRVHGDSLWASVSACLISKQPLAILPRCEGFGRHWTGGESVQKFNSIHSVWREVEL
jgi:hypothetical protein